MSEDDVKYAVVTGVSSGIGYAVTKELIGRGYFVFGSVRKQADAERLQAEFDEGEFGALVFDVTDPAGIATAVEEVAQEVEGIGLWGLVNNAGIALAGPLMHVTPEEIRRQFEVNVFGTLAVTQAFLPLLGAQRDTPHAPGRIVNISSVSGHIAYPFMGPYAMSEAHAGGDVGCAAPGAAAVWSGCDRGGARFGEHADLGQGGAAVRRACARHGLR